VGKDISLGSILISSDLCVMDETQTKCMPHASVSGVWEEEKVKAREVMSSSNVPSGVFSLILPYKTHRQRQHARRVCSLSLQRSSYSFPTHCCGLIWLVKKRSAVNNAVFLQTVTEVSLGPTRLILGPTQVVPLGELAEDTISCLYSVRQVCQLQQRQSRTTPVLWVKHR